MTLVHGNGIIVQVRLSACCKMHHSGGAGVLVDRRTSLMVRHAFASIMHPQAPFPGLIGSVYFVYLPFPCCEQSLEAKTIYVQHQGVIEDVAWHQHHCDIFGSVGDDKQLILWDTRKPPRDGEPAVAPSKGCMKLQQCSRCTGNGCVLHVVGPPTQHGWVNPSPQRRLVLQQLCQRAAKVSLLQFGLWPFCEVPHMQM